ncbi:MAG: hypothetical protein KKD77_22675 [Gammaproteobacteria bacterium]|nr:hypothetical protein [Gammaproteobacteria bacterium]
MTIDEAIKRLEHNVNSYPQLQDTDFAKAQKLGIEALKAVKKIRVYGYWSADGGLPGETEE